MEEIEVMQAESLKQLEKDIAAKTVKPLEEDSVLQKYSEKLAELRKAGNKKEAAELIRNGTTRLILGHLSQENNTPYTADRTVEKGLSGFVRNRDYIMEVAPVETSGKMVVF